MEPPRIQDEEDLDRALEAESFVLFKHSSRCAVSVWAWEVYMAWREVHPEIATGWIDVVVDHNLARLTAERTGVAHESPQALVIRRGRVTWSASHSGIGRRALEEAVASTTERRHAG